MANRRVERVAQAIKREIGEIILRELHDPRISFITVTNVDLSGDLKEAKVYISILGNEKSQKTNIHGLQNARGYIQGEIGRRLNMRYTPRLSFHLDDSLKKMTHINELITDVSSKDE